MLDQPPVGAVAASTDDERPGLWFPADGAFEQELDLVLTQSVCVEARGAEAMSKQRMKGHVRHAGHAASQRRRALREAAAPTGAKPWRIASAMRMLSLRSIA